MDVQNAQEQESNMTRESLAARLLKSFPGDEAAAKWSAEYNGYITRRRAEAAR